MHSHGNRTPPPQNEPSLNNPNNSTPAAASSQIAPSVPASVSTPSTVQAHGPSVSASTALSTPATTTSTTSSISAPSPVAPTAPSAPAANGQTGNAAGHTPGTPNTTADQLKNTQNSKRTTGKDAKTTPATALTRTNAAATPTAKPKTLSTFTAEDFTNAPNTLATFLQRMKSTSHATDNNQTTPATAIEPKSSTNGTLPHATATLTAKQSPVGPQTAYSLTREAPSVSTQDEPMVGPQSNNPRLTRLYADPYDDGHLQISGTADQVYYPWNWVHVVICPTSVSTPVTYPGNTNALCSNIETWTNGSSGGDTGGSPFSWAGDENRGNSTTWTTRDSDFRAGPGYYNIWAYNRNYDWNQFQGNIIYSNYYCSRAGDTTITLTYYMSSMPGASTPGNAIVDTTNEAKSITLAGEPSHPFWQIFDGWYLNGTNYNAGQSVSFPQHADIFYPVTPRWHTKPTSVRFNYNLNGMSGSWAGYQEISTAYSGGSITLPYPPSHPDWQVFEGWTVDGAHYVDPGQTYTYPAHANEKHSVTARWHTRPDTATIHYDMGATGCAKPDDQTISSAYYSSVSLAGTPATCPAHTAFDGWTINGYNYNPGGTFSFAQHVTATYTATARTHTVQTPTGLTAAYHITGTVTLSGTSNVQSGDKVTACMTEGTGATACQPSSAAPNANSAWNWTITFPTTDYITRYGYGNQHHFTAKLTSKGVDSTQADLKGTLPWTTVTFDKGASGGTAPGNKVALTDTTSHKATFTLPGQGSMTAPANAFPDFTGWSDGTTLWQPGSRDIPTNTTGASTDANGHTTLTLTAQWHTVQAPTGVTARYNHTDGYVYLTATGLQAGATDWEIQVKPTASSGYWSTSNTSTTGQSSYNNYNGAFTPGDTWTAKARITYTDSSGHTVTSDWSTEFTGILPYMTVTLDPGQATGEATTIKALVDTGEGKAHLTLPAGIGTPPAGMAFQATGGWASNPNGTGNTYNAGDTAIPTTTGTPGSTGETLVTLYAQWKMRTQAPARGTPCTSVAGWQQWKNSAGVIHGITGQDTGAVCWAIEGSTLRLTGGTSPSYTGSAADIPWNGQKSAITKISIEGDLTLTFASQNGTINTPFDQMANLTAFAHNSNTINLDKFAGMDLFYNDTGLKSLDLPTMRFATAEGLDSMFFHCDQLETLTGISHWDLHTVWKISQMFGSCRKLTGLDLSAWNTSKVMEMQSVFDADYALVDLDLSGWDTSRVNTSSNGWYMSDLLPGGLQRLRLGPKTKLMDRAFRGISASHTWHEWDWPQNHHPADLGPVGATAGASGDGTLTTLKTRAASAHPEGTYIRDDVTPTWTDLTYDLNGGTGDASLPAQIGQAATGGQPKRDGLAIDTTFKDGEYTIPDGTGDTGNAAHHITANKPHSLFNGWTIDTDNVTANASGGTATVSNHTITAAKGAGGTATITAQWTSTPEATPGTPQVTVTPHTTDQGGASVSVSATLDAAMPAIEGGNGDPAKPAVSAGGTVKVCAKPSSQNADFYPVQCTSKTSTTGGSQTLTPEALELPGSARQHSNTASFPDPGEQYTLAAMYTLTDPQTRNQIDSSATQAGGGLTTGTLPWADTTFDTNDSHGGTGTPPDDAKSFVDTASGKAWASLPNATATMKPEHAVFAGWTATASATNPDQGMGDPASRIIQLDAGGATETQTTLYAVWHKLAAPTVTSIKRDTLTNTVTVTGTATPWTTQEGVGLDLTPLDGQGGLTPAGTRYATISPTDEHGNSLAYDGHTAHPWTLTLTANDLSTGGRYRADAKIRAMDQAWRDTNAGFYVYSAAASSPTNLPGYFQHSLPLTGGQRTMLIIALTLLGVFLIGMSQLARNRRRWHHQ
ncbi:BspA family leucine-rich repeat surface protein [Bifidobacterium sp. ESL0690]|uniref:BspA family leucine-rich repeat surface protein n=1 Tax=Bifidobacterium sp. ESL0690 TaxID=2983214 RepID=UPI0023F85869|nr:BspA family leucine-rich repeat surface protein [Bifidobacterium sp. ESL0690]WEV46729.1 BspA family leucine-rich repeat surface protein [Bifidobacterium sp. ESL0690]